MKSPVRLERALRLQQWRTSATLAVATKRDWEPAVLKLAQQFPTLTAGIVSDNLLNGRQGLARRLLDICVDLRLLDSGRDGFRATDAGRMAAETGIVLVPQRGTWSFYIADDPLLLHPVVAAFPWNEPTAVDDRRKDAERSFEPLPSVLKECLDRNLDIPAGPLRALRIDDLGVSRRGERVVTTDKARIVWTLAPGDARCRLTGRVEGHAIDADLPPPPRTHEQVWQSLLASSGWEPHWDPRRRALLVAFNDTVDSERSQLHRSLPIADPRIDALGRFDATRVEQVRLHPRSPDDATTWARWRFMNGLRPYPTDAMISETYLRAAEPFDGLAAPCPPRAELVRHARTKDRPPPQFWWLQAPLDWFTSDRSAR
ncbi:MAG: hypothetical protein R3B70_29445 [Polyangiaceae bacterium]